MNNVLYLHVYAHSDHPYLYEILQSHIRDTLGGIVGEEYADPYGQGRIVAVAEAGSEPEAAAEPGMRPEKP